MLMFLDSVVEGEGKEGGGVWDPEALIQARNIK